MKALLIADDDIVIEKIKASLTDEGYDVITYRWLIKAMDNVEEIKSDILFFTSSACSSEIFFVKIITASYAFTFFTSSWTYDPHKT